MNSRYKHLNNNSSSAGFSTFEVVITVLVVVVIALAGWAWHLASQTRGDIETEETAGYNMPGYKVGEPGEQRT